MAVPAEQAEVAAFLQGLAGHAPTETHISAVFVGEDTVWKLRRAVRLSFLDFSSLAERERTARRELELNAPFAPGLYRDVVPVVRTTGGLALGGEGETVDWVLRMARVPSGDFLDVIADRGGLDPALLDALADAVADMHAAIPQKRRPEPAAVLRDVALGNGRAALDAGLPEPAVRAWLDRILPALAALGPILADRSERGFVRRAHGDLHLGNLCLWPGAEGTKHPVPFDALEFDEDLATIDVGYDVAFLLMDLERRAGRPAANRVMNRYLARTGDLGLLAPLPAFLSLRAMVRAHVEASRFKPERARAYLAQASDALDRPPAVVVAIGGLPGTGKSTLARALAPDIGGPPGAVILRSDEIRKRRHGVAPEARLPQSAYTEPVSRAVLAELTDGVASAIRAGRSVIADATFLDPADRVAIREAAGTAPFTGLWLDAPLAVLEARVAARTGDASDADVDVLRRAAEARPGTVDWTRLDAADSRLVASARAVLPPARAAC